ncbi:DNA repair protein RecO [Mycoplasmopsis ciconiae]|uniref:DNA repair protein RecO n=1 Tax=Mycoplasmopsis ciconiae TaxID=561067 RepID=A0ABU7MLH8_9BACT|nr:DNA repair protein RecO [Mycoplasmopsis ciconiae]
MSQNSTILTQAILLDVFEYKQNEFIVSFLDKKGVFSLFAQGLNKNDSKNKYNCIIGSLVNVEYFKYQGKLTNLSGKMKKVKALNFFETDTIEQKKHLINLQNILKKFSWENDLIDIYDKLIKVWNAEKFDYIYTIILLEFLKKSGFNLNINSCVFCNSHFVCSFSFEAGGFVCKEHLSKISAFKNNNIYFECFWNYLNGHIYYVNNTDDSKNIIFLKRLFIFYKNNGFYISFPYKILT